MAVALILQRKPTAWEAALQPPDRVIIGFVFTVKIVPTGDQIQYDRGAKLNFEVLIFDDDEIASRLEDIEYEKKTSQRA